MTETTAIAEYSKTEAALAELRTKYGSTNYDVSTTAGMEAAKKGRAELRGYRVNLEKIRQEIKAPALEHCKRIDSEARRITAEIEALEDPIDAKIKAEEQRKEREKEAAEAARRAVVEQAQRACNELRAFVVKAVNTPAANIEKLMAEVQAFAIVDNEHKTDVETVRSQTLTQLENLRARALAAEAEARRLEAERVELERLRAEARKQEEAAKAEQEKKRVEQERAAQVERERIEAERRKSEAERAAADAKAAAERKAADEAAAAKRAAEDRIAAEARAKEEARLAHERAKLEAERKAAEDAARKEREAAEAKARAEREAEEAKKREAEAKRQRSLDGRGLLAEFVRKFGEVDEFKDIAGDIERWLDANKPAKKGAA